MRFLFVMSIYVLYLAAVKQSILVLQRVGIIAIQDRIPDDSIIKWATFALFGSIIVIDIIYAIRHKKDFIISAIGAFLHNADY